MKAKLLKKLRKESEKLKLIRGEDYQYIVTDSPHDILRPKLDTYYSGTYYCGQELLFDEDVIAWLHQCRRNWILSEIKRMRVHLRKQGVIEPDGAIYTKGFMWKEHGPLYKTRVIELITISRKEMAKIQRDAYAKRMAIKAGTYVAPPKPKPQAEMEAIKFLKSRGYRITKLITVEQIV